jgi:hypothetical protein
MKKRSSGQGLALGHQGLTRWVTLQPTDHRFLAIHYCNPHAKKYTTSEPRMKFAIPGSAWLFSRSEQLSERPGVRKSHELWKSPPSRGKRIAH